MFNQPQCRPKEGESGREWFSELSLPMLNVAATEVMQAVSLAFP